MSSTVVWMVLLLVLWGGLLLGAFVTPPDAAGRRNRSFLLASSAVLTIAAWGTFFLVGQAGVSPFAFLIAVGMTFGFLGDLLMAQVLPAPNHLLAGMVSFGLGHLFYIAAGILMFRLGVSSPPLFFGAWIAWLLIAAAGWYALAYRGQTVTTLHWIALPYALLLASTVGVGTGLALGAFPGFVTFALGGVLFLASDALIALREFRHRHDRLIVDGIWLTYGPAQMLIVFTIWFLLLMSN